MAKILTIDFESAPNLAYVWAFWKQNIGLSMVKENGYLMSFAAKWLHDDEVIYVENRTNDDKPLVTKAMELMDEADIVIAHNAKKFDVPLVKGRAAVHGIMPPSPFKVVDTLIEARKHFRFPSNSLAYLTKVFGCENKLDHGKFAGFKLWDECIKQNDEAWAEMEKYNKVDVTCLEELYLRMLPWLSNHPNVAIYDPKKVHVCPRCGGKVHKRGLYHTNVQTYQQYACTECGAWSRSRFTNFDKEMSRSLLTSAI